AEWCKSLILPIVYDDQDQVEYFRNTYTEGLRKLKANVSLETPQERMRAHKGVAAATSFYLQYQGCNDLPLQKESGELLVSIMAANFPQWSEKPDMPPPVSNGKIRVGYASACLREHNGALWLLGWLRNRNKHDFEVYCYHTGPEIDSKTREFRDLSDMFHHIPRDLTAACNQIAADKLHILVYPELGMDAQTLLMAGMRLAPVQCVGWGHPITSGLPTMDYWISSDLMEPDNGQEHYTEKLIRLPNIGNYYSREQHDRLQKETSTRSRAYFGLNDKAVLYFCSQSLFKYLPKHDYLFPEIATRVPNAQFVFLAISSVHVVRRFMQRIDQAFKQYNLEAKDYCVMLNRLSTEDYLALNKVTDIFLDNPSWSGNNTTLAALDCYLPVVTCPTMYMRGRHSYGILKMAGLSELIANNEREFIDIAVNLGLNKAWYDRIVGQIRDRGELLYEDTSCVQALEEFYKEAVASQS
ncbi:MAG: glycosyltransferase, partial [Gammaproteobacteria bacterium]